MRRWISRLTLLVLLTITGCDRLIPPRPPVGQSAPSSANDSPEARGPGDNNPSANQPGFIDPNAARATQSEDYEGDWEAWYVHRIGSTIVGMTEFQAGRVIDPSSPIDAPQRVQYSRDERLIFRSGPTQFIRRVQTTSEENADGGVLSLDTQIAAGPVVSEVKANRVNSTLVVNTSRPGGHSQVRLPWPEETRSLFAIEQTLRRRPLEKGQTRLFPLLLPSLKSVGMVELRCPGDASVVMLDGSYKTLREVAATFYEDGKPIDSLVMWIDPEGAIEKSLRPASRLETFLTSRSEAKEKFGPRDESAIYVFAEGTFPTEETPQQVVYEVGFNTEHHQNAAEPDRAATPTDAAMELPAIPAIGTQSTDPRGDTVRVRIGADDVGKAPPNAKDAAADVRPGGVIDSADSTVVRAATGIGELPPADLVSELSQAVRNRLSLAPQRGLRKASAVIRDGRGGDLDHAVVLTAMLRAREIPARVVFGLAPVMPQRGDPRFESEGNSQHTRLKLSAWVIARIDDRWASIDPMTSQIDRSGRLILKAPGGDADLSGELFELFRQLAELKVHILDEPKKSD